VKIGWLSVLSGSNWSPSSSSSFLRFLFLFHMTTNTVLSFLVDFPGLAAKGHHDNGAELVQDWGSIVSVLALGLFFPLPPSSFALLSHLCQMRSRVWPSYPMGIFCIGRHLTFLRIPLALPRPFPMSPVFLPGVAQITSSLSYVRASSMSAHGLGPPYPSFNCLSTRQNRRTTWALRDLLRRPGRKSTAQFFSSLFLSFRSQRGQRTVPTDKLLLKSPEPLQFLPRLKNWIPQYLYPLKPIRALFFNFPSLLLIFW